MATPTMDEMCALIVVPATQSTARPMHAPCPKRQRGSRVSELDMLMEHLQVAPRCDLLLVAQRLLDCTSPAVVARVWKEVSEVDAARRKWERVAQVALCTVFGFLTYTEAGLVGRVSSHWRAASLHPSSYSAITFPRAITFQMLPALVGRFSLVRSFTSDMYVSDDDLEHIASLGNLRTLYLSYCTHITDLGLWYVASLSNLQTLHLQGCVFITDSGLAHVASLGNLQTLDLSCCGRITDAGLVHVASLGNLQTLRLYGCRRITDAGLVYVASLSNLQTLDLWYCERITDAGLVHVASLGNLQTLNLGYCYTITDAGLVHVASLGNLQTLNLEDCESFTDAGLVPVAHLICISEL
jgi:hypothetical protein